MFDIDSGKLLIVAVLALIVIGPKDLPRVLRQLGQAVGKLRRMSAEFQGQYMDAIKDAEIEDIRRELKDLEKPTAFDPASDIQAEMTGIKAAVDGAVQAVEAETVIPSPTKGFDLPAIPEDVRAEAERDAEAMPRRAPSTSTSWPKASPPLWTSPVNCRPFPSVCRSTDRSGSSSSSRTAAASRA